MIDSINGLQLSAQKNRTDLDKVRSFLISQNEILEKLGDVDSYDQLSNDLGVDYINKDISIFVLKNRLEKPFFSP